MLKPAMLCKMKPLYLLLLLLRDTLALPTIEDNMLPTDQEVLEQGQPEEVSPLGLPSDEESFNHLSVFFTPAKPSAHGGSGTYHFVSSTFPVDARGFHEAVFDGIGDYFPSWPAPYKREDNHPFYPSLAQRLGLQPRNKFRKRSDTWAESSIIRRKRVVLSRNSSQELDNIKEGSNLTGGWYSREGPEVKKDRVSSLTKRLQKREANTGEELEEKETGDKSKVWRDQHTASASDMTEEGLYNLQKRSGGRYVRGMEMGSSGFHGDVFNGEFGDFTTMRKRLKGSMGFHGDTFSDGFGDFATMKRSSEKERLMSKLKDYLWKLADSDSGVSEKRDSDTSSPVSNEFDIYSDEIFGLNAMKRKPEMTSMGFHGDTFSGGFGDFYPVKRKQEMDSMGFHGDTFSRGFGEFEPFKKRRPLGASGFHGDTFSQGFGDFDTYKKRRPEMDSMGFHGDTFTRGFGEFEPFKKRRPLGASGFHGDTFSQGFGDFDTYKKRRPEMDSMGFHGDTFTRGFGEFEPFKKRRPMGSSGFHGDTFSQGFGDFDTYKKRRPEMDSMGFHGDTFTRGFGEFEPFKKRRPMGSSGFHGDTFSQGFGDFDTYKKRRPEMDSMGFHGDTFNRGFGDFDVYKKQSAPGSQRVVFNQDSENGQTEEKKCCSDSSIQRHSEVH